MTILLEFLTALLQYLLMEFVQLADFPAVEAL